MEVEMEERGEREERIVDIYVSADDPDPDPGTQQQAVQRNTGGKHGVFRESKNNRSRVAGLCLGLLCLLLMAGIIGLVIYNFELMTENDNLTEERGRIRSNLTAEKYRIQSNLTAEKDRIQSSFDELQTRLNALTEEQEDLKRRLCDVPGWQKFACSCYYISAEKKTWADSRQYCRDKQSDLIVIKSQAEQDFVLRLNQRVWLGLTDTEEEGKFKWVDGTPLTTPTYWYNTGEPNNGRTSTKIQEEDCVEFYNGAVPSSPNKGWNDGPCSADNQWICERVIK